MCLDYTRCAEKRSYRWCDAAGKWVPSSAGKIKKRRTRKMRASWEAKRFLEVPTRRNTEAEAAQEKAGEEVSDWGILVEGAEDEHAEQLSTLRNQWWNARCLPRPRNSGKTKVKLRSIPDTKRSIRGHRDT